MLIYTLSSSASGLGAEIDPNLGPAVNLGVSIVVLSSLLSRVTTLINAVSYKDNYSKVKSS